MRDYAKLKALAQEIIECIGDDSEGENPDLPDNSKMADKGGAGEGPVTDTGNAPDSKIPDPKSRGKRPDDVVALFASTLASKFNK